MIELMRFQDDGAIPNHPALPVIHATIEPAPPAEIEDRLREDRWDGVWVNGVYPFHHYHSTAHELLAVLDGDALLKLGGEGGRELAVRAGDVLVLPAGTGHRRLRAGPDFLVLGAYPAGQRWDLLRGDPSERPAALDRIRGVSLPEADPLGVPVLDHWR